MRAGLVLCLSLLCFFVSAKRFILPKQPPHSFKTMPVPPALPFHFTVHLRQQNVEVLEKKFWEVSDPNHADYGKYLSKKQVDDLVAPKQESVDKVAEWLKPLSNNSKIFFGRTFVTVKTSAGQASQLFETELHHDFDPKAKKAYVRSRGDASIPLHLKEHVHLVTGLYRSRVKAHVDNIDEMMGKVSKRQVVPEDNTFLADPSGLRSYYNIQHTSVVNSVVTQAVFGYQDEYNPHALQSFASTYNTTPNVQNIPGLNCNISNCESGESDLDIQYMTAVGQNAKTYFIAYYYTNRYGFLLETLEILLPQTPTIPMVMSISYGSTELYLCPGNAQCDSSNNAVVDYLDRTDIELMKLGVIGVTVLASSADNGAPGDYTLGRCPINNNYYCPRGGCNYTSSQCQGVLVTVTVNNSPYQFVWPASNLVDVPSTTANQFLNDNANCQAAVDGPAKNQQHLLHSTCTCSQLTYKTYQDPSGVTYQFSSYAPTVPDFTFFWPSYPATSPYVTAVGATIIKNDTNGRLYEAAASTLNGAGFSSGGGFSYYYAQPSYQANVVNAWYNSTAAPDHNLYRITARAYPDISFVGHNFPVTWCVGTDRNSSFCFPLSLGGTSAAAPTVGGMVSLMNDQLISRNLSTIGFLNPLLYDAYSKQPSIFTDVTQGDNYCAELYCCQYGFNATAGWDPVTGLGSFNHAALSSYVISVKNASGATFNAKNFANPYVPAYGANNSTGVAPSTTSSTVESTTSSSTVESTTSSSTIGSTTSSSIVGPTTSSSTVGSTTSSSNIGSTTSSSAVESTTLSSTVDAAISSTVTIAVSMFTLAIVLLTLV